MPSQNARVPALPNGFSSLVALGSICGLLLYVLPACGDDESFFDDPEFLTDTDDTTGDAPDTTGIPEDTTGIPEDTTGASDGTTADGSDGTTEGSDETETDDGETDGETDGGLNVSCRPDNAVFSGEFLEQVGIEIDLRNFDCTVVSGFSALDMLQIDNFGDGVFGGSGSNLTVVDLVGGDFTNNETFFEISNLVTDREIVITFETDDGTLFAVRLTIDSATNSVTNVSVDF